MSYDIDTLPIVIAKNIMPCPTTGCWIWVGSRYQKSGYGRTKRLGECVIHRYIYRALVGEIESGKQIDHLCRLRCCVNPDHLEAVTLQINHHRSRNAAIADRTHCRNGHAYNLENTLYHLSNKGVRCRICRLCARKIKKKIFDNDPQRRRDSASLWRDKNREWFNERARLYRKKRQAIGNPIRG